MAERRPKPAKKPARKTSTKAGAKAKPRVGPAKAKPAPAPVPDERDPKTGEFLPGNRFWRIRASSSGPPPTFADADSLRAACDAYFCWAEDTPIMEQQLVTFQGMTQLVPVPKMRPMTKMGLCRHLGIAHTTWTTWKKDRPELAAVIEWAESVIWDQKFAGAAVGIFNGNLVARELGIADRVAGHDGGALKVQDVTPQRPDDERLMVLLRPFLGPTPGEAIEAARKLTAPDDNEAAEG